MKEGDYVNKWNAIIPAAPAVVIDEEAEFRALEARTQQRIERSILLTIERKTASNERVRRERVHKRRTAQHVRTFACGVGATTSAFGAIVALEVAPALAIFPVVLCAIALWWGVLVWMK